ncbi:hypothetical protein AeNC1_016781, partial [Aphanomyces euteiches]
PEPYLSWINQYGGVIFLREFMTSVALVSDPKALQHILTSNGQNYPRHNMIRDFMKDTLLGIGLVSSEGTLHDAQRKMFNPHFSLAHVKNFIPIFDQQTKDRLIPILDKASKMQQVFDMTHVLQQFALYMIGKIAFSFDFDRRPSVHDAFEQLFQPPSVSTYLGLLYIPGYGNLPFEELRRRRAAKKILSDAIMQVIEQKTASTNSQNDLLDLILPQTTPAEALAHTMTFMTAGHETMSSTLAWVIAEASRRPQVLEKMRMECHQVLEKYTSVPTWEATQELVYTSAVINESLRLNTVVHALLRRVATQDDRVPLSNGSSVFIPKGTCIEIMPAANHRNALYWSKPDEFIAERFIPGTPEWMADEKLRGGKSHTFHFLPFSIGSKNCIGQRFAMAEMLVILAEMVTQFDFQISPSANLRHNYNGLTVQPARLLVTVRRIEASQGGKGA